MTHVLVRPEYEMCIISVSYMCARVCVALEGVTALMRRLHMKDCY